MQQPSHQFHHLEHGEGIEGGAIDRTGQLDMDPQDGLPFGEGGSGHLPARGVHSGQARGKLEVALGGGRLGDRHVGSARLQGFEPADQVGGVRIFGLALLAHLDAHILDQHLEHVHGLEEQFHDQVAEFHPGLAQVVQHVLADVGEGQNLLEPQGILQRP